MVYTTMVACCYGKFSRHVVDAAAVVAPREYVDVAAASYVVDRIERFLSTGATRARRLVDVRFPASAGRFVSLNPSCIEYLFTYSDLPPLHSPSVRTSRSTSSSSPF